MKSTVKKFLLSFTAAVGVALIIPASSFALSPKTDITGVVTNGGHPVSGAKVVVVCNSNSRKDTTDATGTYLVQFPAAQCPAGTHVTVVATKGKKGGTNGATIHPTSNKLNVNIVNVDLPEFGLIAGIGASLIGGGAFLVIRRRQLSGHQA
jgi:hypothetical protein